MLVLLVSFALARDLVLVGERAAPAEHGGWPAVFGACLASARPGAYVVVDATEPAPSIAAMRRALAAAPADAVVLVSMPRPEELVGFGRLGWRRGLGALLGEATAERRDALLFGPWPAARRRVRGSGSVPDSAAGIVEEDARWAAAAEVAAARGVPTVPWDGPDARTAAKLLPAAPTPPARSVDLPGGPWRDEPATDPWSLGRLACGGVLWGLGSEGG